MFRPAQTEVELAAMAFTADRANRPTWLIVGAMVLLIIGLGYSLLQIAALSDAREDLARAQRMNVQIDQEIDRYQSLMQQEREEDRRWRPLPNMASDLVKIAEARNLFETEPRVDQRKERSLGQLAPDFTSWYVECRVQSEPLQAILTWVDASLESPFLRGVFLSRIELIPNDTGWTANLRFRSYQKKGT